MMVEGSPGGSGEVVGNGVVEVVQRIVEDRGDSGEVDRCANGTRCGEPLANRECSLEEVGDSDGCAVVQVVVGDATGQRSITECQ